MSPSGNGPREGIARVVAGHDGKRRVGIVDVSANTDTQSSDRQAGTTPWVDTRPRLRLEPDDVVEARRHAARSGRVGAERERHEAGRHRDGGARARAARDQPPG